MGLLCREVYLNRLCAIRVDVTEDNLLLIPSVARRGGISRDGARGIHSARGAGAGSIRGARARCGASSSRGACAGGARSGGARSGGARSRTSGGARRIRGGGIIAYAEGVSVIQVGFLRGRAHRYRVLAFVAE